MRSNDPVAARAANALREHAAAEPEVALVLGSGLGDLAEAAEESVSVSTDGIEGFPAPTVAGHPGRLVFGRLENVSVVAMQGRAHLYEGRSIDQVTYPVRLACALGCRRLILTNAAGGINPAFRVGTLMLIEDHINFAGAHLRAPVSYGPGLAPRDRVRMSVGPYGTAWLERTRASASRLDIVTHRGTYAWVRGPSYETKAEIDVLRRLGADVVGMSTVPEALQAGVLGMDVLGISTITNPAAGLGEGALSHDDVLAAGRRVRADLERLIRAVLRDL